MLKLRNEPDVRTAYTINVLISAAVNTVIFLLLMSVGTPETILSLGWLFGCVVMTISFDMIYVAKFYDQVDGDV